MSSKTFRIILAGDSAGASKAIKEVQKSGDGLVSSSSSWQSKWAAAFAAKGQKLAEFGQKFASIGPRISEFGAKIAQADGWRGKLSVLGDSGGAALGNLGSKFAGLAPIAALAAAGIAMAVANIASSIYAKVQEAGTYLYELGESMYAAQSKFRAGTGATGAELEGLNESLDNVYAKATRSREELAGAMTLITQKLELSGAPLENMTIGFNRLTNMAGGDLLGNINSLGGAFENWNLTAEEQQAALDQVFRAWQQTGMLPAEIAAQMQSAGPALRDFGYSWGEGLAVVAEFSDEGQNASQILGSMQIALRNMAKESNETGKHQERVTELQLQYNEALAKGAEGADEAERIRRKLADAEKDLAGSMESADIEGKFKAQLEAIKNAGSEAEANELAVSLFGRGAINMADAIRSGSFDIDEMYDTIANGKDTLEGAAKDTGTWRASITMMVHTLENKLRPVAEKVFGTINKVIRENIMPLFRGLSKAWDEGGFEGLLKALPVAFELVKIKLGEWWDSMGRWVREKGPDIMRKFGEAFRLGLRFLADVSGSLLETLGKWLPAIGEWFQNTAVPWVQERWGGWWKSFTDSFNEGGFMHTAIMKLTEFLAGLGNWFITDAVPWAFATGWDLMISLIKWIGTDGIPTAVSYIGSLLGGVIEWLQTEGVTMLAAAGSALWGALTAPFDAVIDALVEKWNSLDLAFSIDLPGFSYSTNDLFPDFGSSGFLGNVGVGTLAGDLVGGIAAGINPIAKAPGIGVVTAPVKPPKPPKLPGLFAQGGVVTRPTLGIIGEDPRTTPEIVSPEKLMRQIVREETGRGGPQVIQFVVDGRVLAETSINGLRVREMANR